MDNSGKSYDFLLSAYSDTVQDLEQEQQIWGLLIYICPKLNIWCYIFQVVHGQIIGIP